ncbi:MAG: sodium-translocating pyrophosphatase [Patescibacteria group bacterium]
MNLLLISLILPVVALIFSVGIMFWIMKKNPGTEEMKKISNAIREGARAFLNKEYKIIIIFVVIITALLWFLLDWRLATSFVFGAFLSALTGNLGMRIATAANSRTAWAAQSSIYQGLKIAFSSGVVMGFGVVSLGLLGIGALYLIFGDPQIIYGFGFGASLIALFARVGGGIFTKAADVGADLVGKIEANIPEDDPRNPAVIADNVGDNVGDVAGMGADLFESYSDSIIAAMVLGSIFVGLGGAAVVFPIVIAALGILASIIGSIVVMVLKKGKPQKILNLGIWIAAALVLVFSFFSSQYFFGNLNVFYAILSGLIAGIAIGSITEYFTSNNHKPTQILSASAQTGAGTNIIAGLALGMKSLAFPVLIIAGAILVSHHVAGLYGIAIAAVGMLSTLGITLATDTYGPVADNAAGIAEMAHLGAETRARAEELDAVGNTTAAVGKGFAISSAALTAVVLGVSYTQIVGLKVVDLVNPTVLVGLFIGGFLPFLFSSFSMSAVGKAASVIVDEVRRQWREIPGLMEGKAEPDYTRCVSISTQSALKQMIWPGLFALLSPVAVGFLLGKEALGAFLIGAIVTGFMLAVMMANSGGAWDNAKKHIEAGNFGGKGSDAHKAAVVGDTVGDPFKDTAGPSLNILVKLMSIIALIIAPLL